MKVVKFVSSCGQLDVFVPVAGLEFLNGEEKSVTDEQAEILLRAGEQFTEVVPAAVSASSHDAEQE